MKIIEMRGVRPVVWTRSENIQAFIGVLVIFVSTLLGGYAGFKAAESSSLGWKILWIWLLSSCSFCISFVIMTYVFRFIKKRTHPS